VHSFIRCIQSKHPPHYRCMHSVSPRLRTGEPLHLVCFWPSPTSMARREHHHGPPGVRWWVRTVRFCEWKGCIHSFDANKANTLLLLGSISDKQYRIANGVNSPMGGALLMIAGDMCQLKSVKSVAFYEKPPVHISDPKNTEYFDTLQSGRQRFMEITDYIELNNNFRQETSQVLGNCLGRCRTNVETTADLSLLNTRFIPDTEQALREMKTKSHAVCLA
jgi:hypothetical protein